MCKVYIAGTDNIPSHFSVGARESLDVVVLVFPGVSADIPMDIDIDGEDASVRLNGLYICGGEEKVSFDVNVRHNAGRGESRQLFNGVAGGTSRAAFHGRVLVQQNSQKIKAFQENHNILLSKGAIVETSPQLEIYADDVECSHGATTGFLNLDEQFYMRSRGIPESEARVLQIISFLAPILSAIPDEDLRESLSARVEQAVRSL